MGESNASLQPPRSREEIIRIFTRRRVNDRDWWDGCVGVGMDGRGSFCSLHFGIGIFSFEF